jgi:hypothetical protein
MTSRYKGVSWAKREKAWKAAICTNYRTRWLGFFKSELEAAYAYDAAAIRLHYDTARINFVVTQ